MANKVIVRLDTFIRPAWIFFNYDSWTEVKTEYRGDNRGFTPDTGTPGSPYYGRFRTAQEFHVDFSTRTLTPFKNTGTTVQRKTYSDGRVEDRSAKADPSCITYRNEQWGVHSVQWDAKVSCQDPFEPLAPKLDYNLHISVWDNGEVAIQGLYDGFPDFESYKKVDGGSWKTIYQFTAGTDVNDLIDGIGDININVRG